MNARESAAPRGQVSRRSLLQNGSAVLAAALATGCDILSTRPDRGTPSRRPGSGDKQAPMLADLVRQGRIPPVDRRLPGEPLVVDPVEEIGEYGGEWRTLSPGPDTDYPQLITMAYENLVRWRPDARAFQLDEIVPNVAASFDFDSSGREYTFSLRPGLRWSDGEPFTADDIVFWYQDVLLDDDITPVMPTWLGSGSDALRVDKVDKHTVRFVFSKSNGLFLHNLAAPQGATVTNQPAHYLKRFHKKYNPDVEREAADAGLDRWADLFLQKSSWFENAERPVLFAWQLTKTPGEAGSRVVADRNPFYWKVDPRGRQLPYIDRISYTMVEEINTMVLKATSGDVGMQNWLIDRLQDKPIYFKNRDRGEYRIYDTISAEMNVLMIGLNMTHKDPVRRRVFSNKNFRIGLSHAINRQEIIKVVYQRQGEPWQGAPRLESPFYDERLAKQYTDYSVDLANEQLDRAGYRADSRGRRLGPDGAPIRFSIDVITDETAAIDALELIRGYWREVGVDMEVRSSERSLWTARKDANEHDAAVWIGDGGLDLIILPRWYAPLDTWGSLYGLPWAQWYASGGAAGEEPPEPARRQMDLYDQVKATADQNQQTTLMKRLLRVAQEEFWAIGVSLTPAGFGVVKNDFRNVPATILEGYMYPNQAPTHPEQYFIRR